MLGPQQPSLGCGAAKHCAAPDGCLQQYCPEGQSSAVTQPGAEPPPLPGPQLPIGPLGVWRQTPPPPEPLEPLPLPPPEAEPPLELLELPAPGQVS